MKKIIALFIFSILTFSCAQQRGATEFPTGEWIDLSHDFGDDTIYWVNAEPFKRTVKGGMTEKGYYYASGNYSAAEHGGTHIDAPFHFAEGKKTVDQLTPSDLIGPAIKIDVSDKAAGNRDYLISVDDIQKWE